MRDLMIKAALAASVSLAIAPLAHASSIAPSPVDVTSATGASISPARTEHKAEPTLVADGAGHDHSSMEGMDMSGGDEKAEMVAVKAGDLSLSHGFLKGMLPGQAVAGGYLTVENGGSADDRLVSVASPVADHVEIHEMTMENDVMKMRQLKDGVALPAGQTVEFKPGGFHVMFMGVKTPVRTGESVKVTFTFEKSGSVEAVLPVVDPRKAGGSGHKHN